MGRPPLPKGEKKTGKTVYLPTELWPKYFQLGGHDWFREQVKRAKPKKPE